MKNINDLIEKALHNIAADRKAAKELLDGVSEHIGESADRYKESGIVAAKFLEVLQRSNEQLVKIVDLKRKGSESDFGNLSDEDKEDLYTDIENGEQES